MPSLTHNGPILDRSLPTCLVFEVIHLFISGVYIVAHKYLIKTIFFYLAPTDTCCDGFKLR